MPHNKQETRTKIAALILFAVSAFLQVYPLGLHPARGMSDSQDCLLNAWILGWGHHQLLRNPLGLFQANAFYPNANTLSYSEHLLPLTLLSLPVALVSSNPILAYNFVFFLCCLLNAYAMFLFVRRLTQDSLAGIAAGLIFAFSATLMQQIAHLQLIAAWFIPLAFLYLQKFFEDGRLKHSILFAVCLTLQALACIYYGLFFLSVLVVLIPAALWLHAEKIKKRFCLRLIWPLLIAGAIMLLFSLPYLWLFRHFHFERPLAAGAEVQNYLAVPSENILLGRLLHPLGSNEYFLFPGIAALALATYFLLRTRSHGPSLPKKGLKAIFIVAGISGAFLLFILITGGASFKLGHLSLSISNPARPGFVLFMALSVWFVSLTVLFFLKKRRLASESQSQSWLYRLLLFWALVLSFGSGFRLLGSSPFNQRFHGDWASPFHWFYNLVPGFKGIRMPSRYSVFVLLSVAVLAGMGWTILAARFRSRKSRIVALIVLTLFLNAEYLAIPRKMELVPTGRDIPPTYLWLKEQPGPMAIAELPFFDQIANESAYMYFSLFHGKSIINGYSGFIPYSSDYIRAVFSEFPSWGAIDILQKLNVKYIILHAKAWKEQRTTGALHLIEKHFRSALKLAQTLRYDFQRPTGMSSFLGEDYIFEVLPPFGRAVPQKATVELSPGRWTVHASLNDASVPLLKDGRPNTAWTTQRPQKKGDFLNIILDEPLPIDRLEIRMGDQAYAAGSNIQINISQNGRQWRIGNPGYSPGSFVRDLTIRPRACVQTIRLSGKSVRYLKIIQKGTGGKLPWSVPELRIYVVKESAAKPGARSSLFKGR